MSLNILLRFSSRLAGTSVRFVALLAALVLIGSIGQQTSVGQEPESAAQEQPPPADSESETASPSDVKPEESKGNTPVPVRSSSSSRKLAPGILQVIEPDLRPEDTFEGPLPLDLVAAHPELAWQAPDFPDGRPLEAPKSETLIEKATGTMLRHSVYGLKSALSRFAKSKLMFPSQMGSYSAG